MTVCNVYTWIFESRPTKVNFASLSLMLVYSYLRTLGGPTLDEKDAVRFLYSPDILIIHVPPSY